MIISILFILILVSFGMLNMIFHTDKRASLAENRILAQFPELSFDAYFSGEYTIQIDDFLRDQFFIRDFCIGFSKKIQKLNGFGYSAMVDGNNLGGSNSNAKLHYYYVDDFCFYNFIKNEDIEKKYAKTIERFAVRYHDINVYNLLVPNSVAYVAEDLKELSDSPLEAMDLIKQQYHNVGFIDVRKEFSTYDLKQLYFKTDHHWNGDGVYAAYLSFCKKLNIKPVSKANMNTLSFDNMLGSLYFMTQNDAMKNSPDTLIAYEPIYPVNMTRFYHGENGDEIEVETVPFCVSDKLMGEVPSYAIYLGGDMPRCIISRKTNELITDGNDMEQKNVVVIKDSFGNAFSTMIIQHYDNVHVIDPRSWNGDLYDYAKEVNADDIIFINTTSTATSFDFVQSIKKILGD